MTKHEFMKADGESIAGYGAIKHSSMNNINMHTNKAVLFLYANNKAIKGQHLSALAQTALQSGRDETCDDLITLKSYSSSVQLGSHLQSFGQHYKSNTHLFILIQWVAGKRTWQQI